ncbi:hypothetical protein AB0F17_57230 [Nonomuraea sp. NPDC026600]|uniref:hypothetical protein n=1 Tax=Nonomuraea sp. NPDC026600 TaxID=3155363 RepID=UPI0033F772E3
MYEMIGMLYQTVPLTLGVVVFLALSWVLRREQRRGHYLLWPAAAWFLAALDEWYMSAFQPQMNIRIDALPLFALMVITTLSCVPMAFLRRRASA